MPEQVEAIIRDGIANGEIHTVDARLLSWELVALVEVALRPYSRSVLGSVDNMANYVIRLFWEGVAAREAIAES